MIQSDEDFREEFKPLHIPSHYLTEDTQENKIIYALAQSGEGSAAQVIAKLEQLEPGIKDDQLVAITKTVLSHLYDKGLIRGREINSEMHYDLAKITHENDGEVNPDLLAPGLD
jgi:predicted transcriptional regulator